MVLNNTLRGATATNYVTVVSASDSMAARRKQLQQTVGLLCVSLQVQLQSIILNSTTNAFKTCMRHMLSQNTTSIFR